jgi:hypothetical protein
MPKTKKTELKKEPVAKPSKALAEPKAEKPATPTRKLYRALANLYDKGRRIAAPDETIVLNDATAEHYMKTNSIELVE